MRTKKLWLKILCGFLAAVILIVLGYLAYVIFTYDRVEDMLNVDVLGDAEGKAPVGQELRLTSYNIGFGAYSDDYSFFMDGGEHSRAFSKDAVLENTAGVLGAVNEAAPDFALFQEVDVDGTRSYHVDQTRLLTDGFSGKDRAFAQNYDSAYLFYPFTEPIGANRSGIMSFSDYNMVSSLRRSLPIEESLYKFLDLDRCYMKSVVETDSGKDLVIYNVHLSAYTSDGTIADEQFEMLCGDMKAEYDKGNYVIAAGDFNKDMLGDSGEYFERPHADYTWTKPLKFELIPDGISCYSGSNAPTCRNAEAPFKGDGSDFVLSVDGMLASDNVEVISCETVDLGFAYSDHNPVLLKFILK